MEDGIEKKVGEDREERKEAKVILFVDDEHEFRESLMARAQTEPSIRNNFIFIDRDTGEEALKLARGIQAPPVAAILDYKFGDNVKGKTAYKNGIDLARQIRKEYPDCVIILLSGEIGDFDEIVPGLEMVNGRTVLNTYVDKDSSNSLGAIIDALEQTVLGKTYLLREVKGVDEIRAHLALRFKVYKDMDYIFCNKDELDLDPWDMHSTFLGAFQRVRVGKEYQEIPIGTLRIVHGGRKGSCSEEIEEIIGGLKDSRLRDLVRTHDLPIQAAFDVNGFLSGIYGEGRPVVQPSKLSVANEFRDHNVGLELSRFALALGYQGLCYEGKLRDAVIVLHPNRGKTYEGMGFTRIPGTGLAVYPAVNTVGIAMHLDMNNALDPYRSRAMEIKKSLQKEGYARFDLLGVGQK